MRSWSASTPIRVAYSSVGADVTSVSHMTQHMMSPYLNYTQSILKEESLFFLKIYFTYYDV